MPDRIPLDNLTSDTLDELYAERDALASDLAELTRARQHAAFTFCPQLVGHVTVAEFARKISEKRTAIAHRAEAVQYAEEQRQRADELGAATDRVRALHRRNANTGTCEHCSEHDYPNYAVPHPCPTITALDPQEQP